jgi:FG-GAP-like repeat
MRYNLSQHRAFRPSDLVIDHDGWDALGVMLQTPRGTFAPEKLYPADSGAETPAVGDLNGDGQPDIRHTLGRPGHRHPLR